MNIIHRASRFTVEGISYTKDHKMYSYYRNAFIDQTRLEIDRIITTYCHTEDARTRMRLNKQVDYKKGVLAQIGDKEAVHIRLPRIMPDVFDRRPVAPLRMVQDTSVEYRPTPSNVVTRTTSGNIKLHDPVRRMWVVFRSEDQVERFLTRLADKEQIGLRRIDV